jgi:hypothetical protein
MSSTFSLAKRLLTSSVFGRASSHSPTGEPPMSAFQLPALLRQEGVGEQLPSDQGVARRGRLDAAGGKIQQIIDVGRGAEHGLRVFGLGRLCHHHATLLRGRIRRRCHLILGADGDGVVPGDGNWDRCTPGRPVVRRLRDGRCKLRLTVQGPFHQRNPGLGVGCSASHLDGHAVIGEREGLALRRGGDAQGRGVVSITLTVVFFMALTLPALSRARTLTLWVPSPGRVTEADQLVFPEAALNEPLLLRRHSTAATPVPASAAVPVTVAV